jgi:hypothetical protein
MMGNNEDITEALKHVTGIIKLQNFQFPNTHNVQGLPISANSETTDVGAYIK